MLIRIIPIFQSSSEIKRNFSGVISAASDRSKATEEDPDTTDQCPEPNGFFADAEQCDKYYQCSDGEIIEKLCPDGMVFNDYSHEYEKCDLPFNIDCSQRPKLRKFLSFHTKLYLSTMKHSNFSTSIT